MHAINIHLVDSEAKLTAAELDQGSNELGRDVYCHDTLLVGVLANDGMADHPLVYPLRAGGEGREEEGRGGEGRGGEGRGGEGRGGEGRGEPFLTHTQCLVCCTCSHSQPASATTHTGEKPSSMMLWVW